MDSRLRLSGKPERCLPDLAARFPLKERNDFHAAPEQRLVNVRCYSNSGQTGGVRFVPIPRTLAEMTFDKTERPPRGGLSEIGSGAIKPISHRTRTDQCRPQG